MDATGAGDCFDGAFAARLVAGDDPFAAARYANAAAALATTGYGAVAPLPRDADVRALLARARDDGATFRDDLFAGESRWCRRNERHRRGDRRRARARSARS